MKHLIIGLVMLIGSAAHAETVFSEYHHIGRIGGLSNLVELVGLTTPIDVTDRSGNTVKMSVKVAVDCAIGGDTTSTQSQTCLYNFALYANDSNFTVAVVFDSNNIQASPRCLSKDFVYETSSGQVCYSVVPSDVVARKE